MSKRYKYATEVYEEFQQERVAGVQHPYLARPLYDNQADYDAWRAERIKQMERKEDSPDPKRAELGT